MSDENLYYAWRRAELGDRLVSPPIVDFDGKRQAIAGSDQRTAPQAQQQDWSPAEDNGLYTLQQFA